MDEVSRDADKRAHMEEEVPVVSISASNHDKRTIKKAVAFSKPLAKADPIKNMTPKTPKAPKVPRRNAQALDSLDYDVLGSCPLKYTIIAHQERETGELTFQLLPKSKTVSHPKDKRVAARAPATPKKIGMAHISAFSGLKDHIGYTEFQYDRASSTILRKIHGHQLPILIDGGSEICVMSEEVGRVLNIGWKRDDCKTVTADGNQSDITKVAESIPDNFHGIVIPILIFIAKS